MIQIHQCKQDCCIVREPSKRFWYIKDAEGTIIGQETKLEAALAVAGNYLKEAEAS